MKKLILILVIVFSAIVFAFEINIESFNASSDSKVITLEWKSSDETYVKSYELERTSGQIFTKVATFSAKGFPSSYKFVDETALSSANNNSNSSQQKSVFTYRIKLIGKDNSSIYTNPINVTHSVSSVRKTWGMLKEMFR